MSVFWARQDVGGEEISLFPIYVEYGNVVADPKKSFFNLNSAKAPLTTNQLESFTATKIRIVYNSQGLDMYVNGRVIDTSRNGGLLMHSEKFSSLFTTT